MVRPAMKEALTTTWPVGAITPGVTIGSSCGENVTIWPFRVVSASRGGKAASASTIDGAGDVVVGDAIVVSDVVVGDALSVVGDVVVGATVSGIGDGLPLGDASTAPHDVSSKAATMIVLMPLRHHRCTSRSAVA